MTIRELVKILIDKNMDAQVRIPVEWSTESGSSGVEYEEIVKVSDWGVGENSYVTFDRY